MDNYFLCLMLLISAILNAILMSMLFLNTYSDSSIEGIKYLTRSKLS